MWKHNSKCKTKLFWALITATQRTEPHWSSSFEIAATLQHLGCCWLFRCPNIQQPLVYFGLDPLFPSNQCLAIMTVCRKNRPFNLAALMQNELTTTHLMWQFDRGILGSPKGGTHGENEI